MEISHKIEYQRPLISVQDIINFIDKGEKYIKSDLENLSDNEQLEVLHGIVLSPDYQRQYRSTLAEEASIIESLLLGIPIPEIFLVRTSNAGIQLRHVMDGQHRLTAIYRFVKDKFALKNLEILSEDFSVYNKRFSELNREHKIKILGSHLSILEFFPFEDDEIEIELFKRYNRNTKPLEKHEIAMATYYSKTSQFITNFINEIIENSEKKPEYWDLVRIYNITKDRKDKQKNHQELCILLSILLMGPDLTAKDGVEAANNFLKSKSKLFKNDEDENLGELKLKLDAFNQFVLKLSEVVEYPFSNSIYKISEKRMAKYHVGVSMVLAVIFYYFEIDIDHPELSGEVRNIILKSPLGDIEYNASSTNTRSLVNYLIDKNNIFNEVYNSLTLKESFHI
ncbi:hypothetical protein A8F94_20060 [Bacillus sp. FJAT-27225]|uniref:DUF262 domain-containing protein n=1 Tax=Bacillus sp. FJAT-27225 TaxID=1743144 RepID=UPI00080C2376|nr:DUF262 domain-containing protein [Bacillus sp. FJAT-27225]OCA82211.1 hypothetical protein A8F94_20060 [Bacillus sp. FJAT-27225]